MNLTKKVGLSIFLVLIVSFLTQFYFAQTTMKDSFLLLEKQSIEQDITRVATLLKDKGAEIAGKASDWGTWDDVYFFILEKKPNFIKENYSNPLQSSELLGADFQMFINHDNKLVFSNAFNIDTKEPMVVPFDKLTEKYSQVPITESIVDIVQIEGLIYMVGAQPVIRSDGTGEPVGRIILGKLIDKSYVEKLKEITKLNFNITNEKSGNCGTAMENSTVSLNLEDQSKSISCQPVLASSNEIVGYITLQRERAILGLFKATQDRLILFSVTIGLVFLLALMFSIYFFVIKPLKLTMTRIFEIETNKDISQRLPVASDDEIGKLSKSMNRMLEAIQKHEAVIKEQQGQMLHNSKMSTLGEMAGGVAHEINNPLTIITLKLDRILSEADKNGEQFQKFAKLLNEIKRNFDRIANIVRGLRTFSGDASSDSFNTFNFKTILDESLSLCTEKFKNFDIDLKTQGAETVHFIGNNTLICQVLVNLLNNSFDAIKGLNEKWVHINWYERDGKVFVEVIDSGSGIPDEIAAKMFNPFFTTREVGSGTGLGLSIARGVIQNHKGNLTYEKRNGHTTFIMSLPAAEMTLQSLVS